MSCRSRYAAWSCATFVLCLTIGCSKGSSSTSSSAGSGGAAEKWKPFALPDYTRLDLEEVSAPLREEIEQHQAEIDDLFNQRERLPLGQRYSIPTGEDAYTARKFEAAYFQFRLEQDLDTYRRYTADRGEAAEKGELFLTEYDRMACNRPDAKTRDEIKPLADAAVTAGSSDPILLAYRAILLAGKGEREGLLDALLAQKQRLTPENSSSLTRGLVADWIWTLVKERKGDMLVDREHQYAAIDAWIEYLADHADASNQRIVWSLPSIFYDRLPREQQQEFLLAGYANGKVHPWVLNLVTGIYFSDLGYDHRGSGWASTVTADGWEKLEQYSGLAEQHLLRAWRLAPEHPQPAWKMIWLATHGHSSRWNERDWFYESVRAQIDWMPAYRSLSNARLPRWGGSHEQMLELASECIATERYDTCVPTFLTSVMWSIQEETGELREVARRPDAVVLIRKCIDGLKQAVDAGQSCPGASDDVWAQLGFYLICAQEYETAKECLERIKDQKWLSRPQGWIGMKVAHARGLVYASTGPAADNVIVFEELLNHPSEESENPEAMQELIDLVAESRALDTQPQAQPYFADVEAVARQLKAFYADEWVSLPFDEQLSGWYVQADSFELQPDGILQLASTANNLGIQLKPLARFTGPIICEAELHLRSDWTQPNSWTGLIYGPSNSNTQYDSQEPLGLFVIPHESMVVIWDKAHEEKYRGRGVHFSPDEFQLLRLKLWENAVDLAVNHLDIATEELSRPPQSTGFTVGEYFPARRPNQFRVRNVRIRRASWGPQPKFEDLDAYVAFQTGERDNDPLDPNAWYHLAYGLTAQKQFSRAIEALESCERLNPQYISTAYLHGHLLLSVGRYADAIPYYRQAIARNPNHMESHSNLAWILSTSPVDGIRDPEEALTLAQRACELAEYNHCMPLTALAGAHAERGEFDAAKQWIAKALLLAPEDSREITLQRQSEIEAGRPLRDEPSTHDSESKPFEPGNASGQPASPAN